MSTYQIEASIQICAGLMFCSTMVASWIKRNIEANYLQFIAYTGLSAVVNLQAFNFIPALENIAVNIFTVFEFFLFANYLRKIMKTSWILVYYYFAISIFILVNMVTFFRISVFKESPEIILTENVLIISLCILYFKALMNDHSVSTPLKNIDFWIVTGMFIYTSLTTPYFLLYNAMSNELSNSLYPINGISNIIMLAFFSKGFTCQPLKPRYII